MSFLLYEHLKKDGKFWFCTVQENSGFALIYKKVNQCKTRIFHPFLVLKQHYWPMDYGTDI